MKGKNYMKIICPKCKKEMKYTISMTLTDKQDCPKCGNVLDLKDCTLLVWMRIILIVLVGALVYLDGDKILGGIITDPWLRLLPLVFIAAVPIFLVLHIISPVIYNKIYVKKIHLNSRKKLGR